MVNQNNQRVNSFAEESILRGPWKLGYLDYIAGYHSLTLEQGFECYRLIYKRACQGHFSPCAGCAGLVRDIQPL